MQEKRRTYRIKGEIPVSFEIYGQQGKERTCYARTVDISAKGFSLSSKEKLVKGQVLKMQVSLPGDKKFRLDVQVMWVKVIIVYGEKEYVSGVKIMEPVTKDSAEFVKFYVKELISFFDAGKKK